MRSSWRSLLCCAGVLTLLLGVHLLLDPESEPFFNNDETRHLMTGVFFRDLLVDLPLNQPQAYAENYYLQYPALGLLVWPPLLHLSEGAAMLLFGPSVQVGRGVIAVYGLLAGLYLFRLFLRRIDAPWAALCVLLIGLTPLVYIYSHYIMGEMPTLAFVAMSIFYFERCLESRSRWDPLRACVFAAFAALTRFDGAMLLPYFLLRLGLTHQLSLLRRPAVILGILLALGLIAPFYYLAFKEYGSAMQKAVSEGTSAEATSFLARENLLYYPSIIPNQIGWAGTVLAVVGLLALGSKAGRERLKMPLALMLATYGFFTPLAELEERHAIYWIPALVMLIAEGIDLLQRLIKIQIAKPILYALVIALTGWTTWNHPPRNWEVHGYEDAARFVLKHNTQTPVCLMDGFLNGGFIYYTRLHDPERKLWVLRGDKLFYSVLSDPNGGYEERVKNRQEMLDLIFQFDPELIVLEEPEIYFTIPAAKLLRETIHGTPERFSLIESIPLRTNHHHFNDHRLEIYRNLKRNPNRNQQIEIEMMNLQRSLKSRTGGK
jgi:hypothetical protein